MHAHSTINVDTAKDAGKARPKIFLESRVSAIHLVLFLEWNLLAITTELYKRKSFVKNKNNKKKMQFFHFPVWYPAGVSAGVSAIRSSP